MKTALLLTNSAETQRLLTDILGEKTNIVLLPLPAEPSREQFDALFSTWLRLVDAVILDAVSLGETTRWAAESLASSRLREHQAVVVQGHGGPADAVSAPGELAGRFRFGFRRSFETGAGHLFRIARCPVQTETGRRRDCPATTGRPGTGGRDGSTAHPSPDPHASARAGV